MPAAQGASESALRGEEAGEIIELAGGWLYALCNPYEVDGRVSWHSPAARGYAPMNSYVFKDDDAALLVDPGLSAHEAGVLSQLSRILDDRDRLALFPLRVGEFDSICNVVPIARRYELDAIYALSIVANPGWFDLDPPEAGIAGALDAVPVKQVPSKPFQLHVGDRQLEVFDPAVRLLNTHWIYDHASKALLTSDLFGHVLSADPSGRWVVDEISEGVTQTDVRSHLLETRYWWLEGARVDDLRRGLAEPFERYDVEIIAPTFGCILRGADVVRHHYEMVDAILRDVGR
jgi:glyoxylase-like metal-dependent hydrolase (beta-lactamase superfamily II)